MEQADNLLLRIQKYDKTFSKGQKRLAAYVLKNYDKAVFLTCLLYTSPSPRDCD